MDYGCEANQEVCYLAQAITSNNTRLVNVMGLQTTLAFYITNYVTWNDTQKKVKRKKIERIDTHTIKKGVYWKYKEDVHIRVFSGFYSKDMFYKTLFSTI